MYHTLNVFQTLHDTRNEISSALADDFDTSKAMHAVINLIGVGNKMLYQSDVSCKKLLLHH